MKVVIVGGGFGGVRSALNLANKPGVEVTFVSDKSYFEYHAALYRSATGRSPLEVVIPLTKFFRYANNIEIVSDKVDSIEPDHSQVIGSSGSRYHYDSLILALGSTTQYFGIEGLDKYSYGVKTINEALELKRHLHDTLVAGHEELNYVVVGAGPSGVELAGELRSYLKKLRHRHRITTDFNVDLVEASDRILPTLKPKVSTRATKRLRKLGVTLYPKTAVKTETIDAIELPRGKISSHTVIWTAGVINNPFFKNNAKYFQMAKNSRVEVDQFLQASPAVYVVGDCANTKYSGTAQTAIHDANFVSKNILRQVKGQKPLSYRPKLPVYAVPIGPRWSAVQWNKLQIYGYPGWILRRLADLRLFIKFLPPAKALSVWKYGIVLEEDCDICK